MKASMLVMNYPVPVKMTEDIPAHEDFNFVRPNNHRAMDQFDQGELTGHSYLRTDGGDRFRGMSEADGEDIGL